MEVVHLPKDKTFSLWENSENDPNISLQLIVYSWLYNTELKLDMVSIINTNFPVELQFCGVDYSIQFSSKDNYPLFVLLIVIYNRLWLLS